MSSHNADEDLRGLETALGFLRPAPSRVNRDTLMFRAGRASVRARGWGWPVAAAAIALVAAVLGGALLERPAPGVEERVVYVPVEQPQAPAYPGLRRADRLAARGYAWASYIELRRRVFAEGLDVLPSPEPAETTAPLSLHDILLDSGGST